MTRTLLAATVLTTLAQAAHAQLVLNEANTVSPDKFLDNTDTFKPYEGFDYGIVPHSGHPGNPFPADLDGTAGIKTTLPNGWTLANPTGFGHIAGNGGDWIELVVTTDHLDMRGYIFYWENDETNAAGQPVQTGGEPGDGVVGSHPAERGFVQFSNHDIWSNVRAGTIITISEDRYVLEGTGHIYDLSTDTSFRPLLGDWHMHFHLDELVTQDLQQDTAYFKAHSDLKVDNDRWRAALFSSANTLLPSQVENPALSRAMLDLTTGLIGGFVGESAPGHGQFTGGGGVGSDEVLALISSPASGNLTPGASRDARSYEDVDFSSFGRENPFNVSLESELDGAQDFSALRAWTALVLPGDANNDGVVDYRDFLAVEQHFGTLGLADGELFGDANDDGRVDGDDWLAVERHFGAALPLNSAVPEPATAGLLVIGIALLRRRRRG